MPSLARKLTLADAVSIGLGSMIGAGVFAVFAPAAAVAGSGLLLGLVVAAVVAFANATSSAQLAARYPSAGGSYFYGREEIGPWWGFLAGWGFVIGKSASCAAMALTFAAHVVPQPEWQRPVAALAVIALTAVNYRGITRTAALTRVLVTVVLSVLALVVALNLASPGAGMPAINPSATTPYGVLQAAGLIFFAFAGYARIATLGEEVIDPGRTIPRAIVLALGLVIVVYLAVAASVLGVLGAEGTAATSTPLASAVAAGAGPWAVPIVTVGAAAAALGALLALIAGVGRTALAMAREGDLPRTLAAVHPRYQVPHHADITLAAVVSGIVLVADLRGAIGFSSFGVLLYYFVANVAAFRQAQQRLYPRWLQGVGMVGCLALVVTLPWQSVATGAAMFALGIGYRLVRRRAQPTEAVR